MGGRSPGRTLGPVVAGPAGLDDGLAVGEETGTEVAEGVGDDLAAPPLQAVATNVHRRAPDVLDHARVDEPTRTESCSASPTSGGPIGINAAHVTPRKIRRSV